LARVLAAQNKRDAAEDEFRAAIDLAPGEGTLLAGYADLLLSKGNLDEAEALADQALHADPDDSDVLVTKGEVLLRRGRLDEATEFALWALQRDATDRNAIALLAQIKMRRNPVLGLWWRWATWMESFGGWKAWVVVILIYFAFQVFRRTLLIHFPPLLQSVVIFAWFGFAVLTWVGPSILRWMINAELKRVRWKPDF
jgi:tetratricopeptide (TPR) repeat protein